ncbi:hypothetical protein ACFLQY_05825 [Verrucomicrobiota bacterium]
MKNTDSQIWAYLHDELAQEQRQQFEATLENSGELRQALEERQSTHKELQALLPLLEDEDTRTAEALLAEWETEHPKYQEQPPRKKIIKFPLLAAAAAALVMLVMQPWSQGPIDWQRTAIGAAPQLRGESGVHGHYSSGKLRQAARDLQEATETRLMELTDTPAAWRLQIAMQELAEGALDVEVSGHPRSQPEQTEIWSRTFVSLPAFREGTGSFAHQIAEDIGRRNN